VNPSREFARSCVGSQDHDVPEIAPVFADTPERVTKQKAACQHPETVNRPKQNKEWRCDHFDPEGNRQHQQASSHQSGRFHLFQDCFLGRGQPLGLVQMAHGIDQVPGKQRHRKYHEIGKLDPNGQKPGKRPAMINAHEQVCSEPVRGRSHKKIKKLQEQQ
jgi:hypothetical protein